MNVSKYSKISLPLAIILLTSLAYLPMFTNPFIGDDLDFIKNKPFAQLSRPISKIIEGYNPVGHEGTYRPVKNLVIFLTSTIFGDNVVFYHVISLIIHLACALLLFSLSKKLDFKPFTALIISLVFSLHPIAVESIAWMTASFDALGFAFVLLVLNQFAAQSKPYIQKSSPTILIITLIAFFTYELTLIIPVLVALIAVYQKRSRILQIVMPYALMAVVYIIIRQYVIAVPDRSAYPQEATIPLLSQSIRNVGLYAKQLVYPPPLSINHQLPHQVAAHTLYHLNQKALTTMPFGDKYSLAILLFLAANIVGILHTKKITPVIFSSMWFLCSLLLSLPLITNNPNLYSERYAYLAIMGFAIGIGALFQTLCSSYPRQISKGIVLLLFSGYLSFLFILTNQRTYVWSSESGLLDDALTKTMHHPMLMYQRGLSYQQKGDLSRAQTSYLAALYLEPNFSYPYINLGYISEQNGDASTAAKLYVKASRTDPPSPIPWFNLAVFAHNKGDHSQSSEYLSKSLSIDPEYIPALELLSKWP